MNNDLIRREYIKLFVCEFEKYDGKETKIIKAVPIQAIDNAPTVEPFEPDYVGAERLKAKQSGYEESYHYGMKIGKTLNPKIKQGEWLVLGGVRCICSVCKGRQAKYSKYCPDCGARLLKASEGAE